MRSNFLSKSKLLSILNIRTDSDKSPLKWILGGALVFAVIFTGGYATHLMLSEYRNQTDTAQPIAAAAIPGEKSTFSFGSHDSTGSCGSEDPSDNSCLIKPIINSCKVTNDLCHADIDVAKTAWKYFENNYHPETGLVNAVNNYPSTTMWDTGSALAATITAREFNLIDAKSFDQRIMAMFKALSTMKLFNNEAPNKVYNTKTMEMVDYGNKVSENGIGVSILDLARLVSWMNTLNCLHPQYHGAINAALSRWDYSRLIQDGSMYGMARGKNNEIKVLQEGRLGYEQYAAKILQHAGFDLGVAADYENEFRTSTDIMGVSIAHDTRDPREFGANNYVVTESYAMDAMESGIDDKNRQLLKNIFEVQKRRWQETGIVTAISEDNIDQSPWFLYNSIFNAGLSWQTTNSSNTSFEHLKSVSVKAALSMAMLFPDDEYSRVLTSAVAHAYDPDKGWYSGVYESGAGYNTALTANTNGVILGGLLYKKYGALIPHCQQCSRPINISSPVLENKDEEKVCASCTVAQQ